MDDFKVPSGEVENRIKRLQDKLQDSNIDGMLIVQRVDLFYFTGTSQNGLIYIPAQGEPLLFIKKYFPRAQRESSIKRIVRIKSVKEIPGMIMDLYGHLPAILGLEFDVLPVNDYHSYQALFKAKKYVDGSPFIHETRMIKSPWEVEQLEKTAELSGKTFEYMRSIIRPGISEMEFSGMFEPFARKHGHGGYLNARNYQARAYAWHILSGNSGGLVGHLDAPASGAGTSAAFPAGAGNKLLSPNEPIMIDLGTVVNGYHTDETRMFAIGSMPERAMKACQASIEIHNTVLENVKPGVTVSELFRISVAKAESLGYADQYLGPVGHKVTFIGHGIGLELTEHPIIARNRDYILEPGMTFSLEPKMVFENEFSAGIESIFLVTETGHRLISKVPVDIFICPRS
jgi:Xaa-Pro dipeptidase